VEVGEVHVKKESIGGAKGTGGIAIILKKGRRKPRNEKHP